MKEKKGFMRLL